MKYPEGYYNKHLKKVGVYNGWNKTISVKIRIIIKVHQCIIIKFLKFNLKKNSSVKYDFVNFDKSLFLEYIILWGYCPIISALSCLHVDTFTLKLSVNLEFTVQLILVAGPKIFYVSNYFHLWSSLYIKFVFSISFMLYLTFFNYYMVDQNGCHCLAIYLLHQDIYISLRSLNNIPYYLFIYYNLKHLIPNYDYHNTESHVFHCNRLKYIIHNNYLCIDRF